MKHRGESAASQAGQRRRRGGCDEVLPLLRDPALAGQVLEASVSGGDRAGRPRRPARPRRPPRAGESLAILFKALDNERFSYDGRFYKIDDSHIVPRPSRKFRVFLGGTSDRTYELAAERGWAIVVPPLLPYA